MGRTITPAHAIEYVVDNGRWTPAGWDAKHAGRPTAANLAAHCQLLEDSTMPGGCNEHLGPTRILAARIVTNRGERREVAAYRRAA